MKTDYLEWLCHLLDIQVNVIFYVGGNIYNPTKVKLPEEMPFEVKGQYFPKENILYMNFDVHENENEILLTMTKELRHAYQYHQICLYHDYINGNEDSYDAICERSDIIKVWQKEWIHPEKKQKTLDLDAEAFTIYMGRQVLEIEVKHDPKFNEYQLQEWIDYIALSLDEEYLKETKVFIK